MSDPRDRDYQWTEHKLNFTVTDLGVVNTNRVWRWRVKGREIVSQDGMFGWLRPTVKDISMLDLIEERIGKAHREASAALDEWLYPEQ